MPPSLTPYTDHVAEKEIALSAPMSEVTAKLQEITAGPIREWVRRYNNTPAGSQDIATALAFLSFGDVVVVGYSKNTSGNWDIVLVRYNSVGVWQGTNRYNGPANRNDFAYAAAFDDNENIYVTGSSLGVNGFEDTLTIKYSQNSPTVSWAQEQSAEVDEASANETGTALPSQFDLAQNFPNPFNPSTTIRFDMPSFGRVKLAVYNLRGELVRTLVDGEIAAGYHTINFEMNGMASGIYFYKMDTETFTATRKMILQK